MNGEVMIDSVLLGLKHEQVSLITPGTYTSSSSTSHDGHADTFFLYLSQPCGLVDTA